MKGSSTSQLITAFILLIVGVGLLTTIATSTAEKTEMIEIRGEKIDLSVFRNAGDSQINETVEANTANVYVTTDWQYDGACEFASVVFRNATNATATVTTDYIFNTSVGSYKLVNTTTFNVGTYNVSYVDYDYCEDNYLPVSWNRSVINLVPGFFALALLLIAVALFYNVMKQEGIINI